MRVIAIFPFLCALVAFILSMLCMFAGNKPGFMENYDLLTLNTSMLGEPFINSTESSSGGGGILGSLEGELQDLENDLKNDLKGAIHDLAQALGIHDFYSVHLLDYCEGYYEPGPLANATETPWKNVTSCSNGTSFFVFDPQQILQSQLNSSITLDQLKFPDEVQQTIQTVETAVKAMFVLYCIGIACSALAFLGAIIAFFTDGRLAAGCNSMLDIIAFLALGIASAISTVMIVKVVDAINQYGDEAGIAAYKGSGFLGMTWAATALMFLASVGWCVDCCVGPSRRKRSHV